ncbi:hypothetical protein [Pleionea sediminis]|uniref:hypothetical protein n=1 Tax=Pleionea sediminis TaxID=2569479 RepID=UPI0011867558|nr:hypothetical protein [Pleionea sediminis]
MKSPLLKKVSLLTTIVCSTLSISSAGGLSGGSGSFGGFEPIELEGPIVGLPTEPDHRQSDISTGLLGGGYDTWYDQYSSVMCLREGGTEVTGGEGIITFGQRISASEMEERLKINVNASYTGDFNAGGSIDYLNETKDSRLSLSAHFLYDINTRNVRFIVDDENPLTTAGQRALNGGYFRGTCGDHFVNNRALGGKLAIALKFKFSSEYYKNQFNLEASGGVPGVFDASIDIESFSEELKKNTSLTIVAYQLGGSPERLADVLGAQNNGTGFYAAGNCRIEDINQCNDMITQMINYAQNEFSNSVNSLPAITEYATSPYLLAGVNVDAPQLPRDIADARSTLRRNLDENKSNLQDLTFIREYYAPRLSNTKKTQLDNAINEVELNIEDIKYATETCYTPLSVTNGTCVVLSNQINNDLYDAPSDLFIAPDRIVLRNQQMYHEGWNTTLTCQAPEGHVISGYGGRVYKDVSTIVLEVRELLQSGELGPRKEKMCGTPSALEKMVTLPEGYVMTGFAGHTKRNNFIGLTAHGRQYNSFSSNLTSNKTTQVDGSSGIEMQYNIDEPNTLVTGIGLRVYSSNIRGFDIYTSQIELEPSN